MLNIVYWTDRLLETNSHIRQYREAMRARCWQLQIVYDYRKLVTVTPVGNVPAYPELYNKDGWDSVNCPVEITTKIILDAAENDFWLRKALEKAFSMPLAAIVEKWAYDADLFEVRRLERDKWIIGESRRIMAN